MKHYKHILFLTITAILTFGLLEIILSLLIMLSPKVDKLLTLSIPIVADARLGHRPSPNHPEHDHKGFRNTKVPTKAHIVALGDSQTYGVGVAAEEAWPRQLETTIGNTVYSMAFGGYGPAHSLALWEEGASLSPSIVIEAFYAGNDLYDSFNLVYNKKQLPELKTPDHELQAAIQKYERSESIAKHVGGMLKSPPPVSALRLFLSEHSKIYALLRSIWRKTYKSKITRQQQWDIAKASAEENPASNQVFNNGQFKTIFTSEYRLSALNLKDARIAEGLQVSLRSFQKMNNLASAKNIRFIVLMIPTKEAVFRKIWQTPSMSYRRLVENEEHVWRITQDFLKHNSIEYIDALPSLREQLALGIQPYQVSSDGHPNEIGHKVITRLIATYLNQKQL